MKISSSFTISFIPIAKFWSRQNFKLFFYYKIKMKVYIPVKFETLNVFLTTCLSCSSIGWVAVNKFFILCVWLSDGTVLVLLLLVLEVLLWLTPEVLYSCCSRWKSCCSCIQVFWHSFYVAHLIKVIYQYNSVWH